MPVKWISRRQKTVETSSYGSELAAARVAVEAIIEFRYKLRMLGVRVEKYSYMLGDNMSVILNTTLPSSPLKKKHCAISYNRLREVQAVFLKFAHISSEQNVADILTKPLPPDKFLQLARPFLFLLPHERNEIGLSPEQAPLISETLDEELLATDIDIKPVIRANPSYARE
jgi:hypothetical protein